MKMFCDKSHVYLLKKAACACAGRKSFMSFRWQKWDSVKTKAAPSRPHPVPAGPRFTLSCFRGACRFIFNVFWNCGRRRRAGMMQFTGLFVLFGFFLTAVWPCMFGVQWIVARRAPAADTGAPGPKSSPEVSAITTAGQEGVPVVSPDLLWSKHGTTNPFSPGNGHGEKIYRFIYLNVCICTCIIDWRWSWW